MQCKVEMGECKTMGGRRRRPQAENTDNVRFSQATLTTSLGKSRGKNGSLQAVPKHEAKQISELSKNYEIVKWGTDPQLWHQKRIGRENRISMSNASLWKGKCQVLEDLINGSFSCDNYAAQMHSVSNRTASKQTSCLR